MVGRWIVTAVAATVCVIASGRDAAGLLNVVITPNEGVPAIAHPGGIFDAVLTAQGELRLENGDTGAMVALSPTWKALPGGRQRAQCSVPGDTPTGTYAVRYSDGTIEDRVVRAVWVVAEFPETYTIAHLTDTHVGSDRHPRASTDIFRDMIAAVNASEASFAVITGDLTENGAPQQFQSFLAVLNECTKPTFVCAGNHDRDGLHYERAFGPLTYWFTFGVGDHRDGYLVFDTKDFVVAGDLDGQDGLLQRYRRDIMPCRWRIGLTHRYELDMGMRSQLTLFVDNPLDYLIYGHWHRENATNVEAMPWPGIGATVTPAAINGAMRFFSIGAAVEGAGIEPGLVQHVTEVSQATRSAQE